MPTSLSDCRLGIQELTCYYHQSNSRICKSYICLIDRSQEHEHIKCASNKKDKTSDILIKSEQCWIEALERAHNPTEVVRPSKLPGSARHPTDLSMKCRLINHNRPHAYAPTSYQGRSVEVQVCSKVNRAAKGTQCSRRLSMNRAESSRSLISQIFLFVHID